MIIINNPNDFRECSIKYYNDGILNKDDYRSDSRLISNIPNHIKSLDRQLKLDGNLNKIKEIERKIIILNNIYSIDVLIALLAYKSDGENLDYIKPFLDYIHKTSYEFDFIVNKEKYSYNNIPSNKLILEYLSSKEL